MGLLVGMAFIVCFGSGTWGRQSFGNLALEGNMGALVVNPNTITFIHWADCFQTFFISLRGMQDTRLDVVETQPTP